MNYFKRRGFWAVSGAVTLAAFNLYFIFLIPEGRTVFLLYVDFLLLVPAALWMAVDYGRFWRKEREKERLLAGEDLICREGFPFENLDIAEHDAGVLERQLRERFQESCELQDYVAKWCHEMKLPLAAAFLMEERIGDRELKREIRGQLEQMNRQVSSLLLGCRLQGQLFDVQVKPTPLKECVTASIRNNQFFLIQKDFALTVEVGEQMVYTDPQWLVYVLDQLVYNAVKYAKDTSSSPKGTLRIWAKGEDLSVMLFVEDRGVGILDSDLPRIFEKGFTGRNFHNGKYKSTGMGLYMAEKILGRLGHEIGVESEYGEYTRFCIVFRENPYYRF